MGYKDPPQYARFQKGHSGNPSGRPKKVVEAQSRTSRELILKVAERPIKVREGDQKREVPAAEAAQTAQLKSALDGNSHAQQDFLRRYDQANAQRQHEIAEQCADWKRYIASCKCVYAQADRTGQPRPVVYPHPDDIVIDEMKGVSFLGPLCQESADAIKNNLEVVDRYLMQNAVDERLWTAKYDDPLDGPGAALALGLFVNAVCLPKRYRLDDWEIKRRIEEYASVPKRELIKQMYRRWKAANNPFPRGYKFATLRAAKRFFERLAEEYGRQLRLAGNED